MPGNCIHSSSRAQRDHPCERREVVGHPRRAHLVLGVDAVRVHSPTSRSGSRIYLSIWDLFWALVSPILALHLRDVDVNADWSVTANYWVLSAGFAILAFFAFRLQDGMTRYFSVHEALDIAEAVLFAELMTFAVLFTLTRLDGIPRSMPLVHGLLLAAGLLAARVFVRIVQSGTDEPVAPHRHRERIGRKSTRLNSS